MNYAIILCGGKGERMGINVPKQYLNVGNRYIFSYCLNVFDNNDNIDAFIICAHSEWRDLITDTLEKDRIKKKVLFSEPGETRQMTIYNALKVANQNSGEDNDIVIIHDAVRPLVNSEIIDDCFNGCIKNDASIATIEVKDTIYRTENGEFVTEVPKRSFLRSGQTPEAFNLLKYLKIHNASSNEYINSVTGGAEFALNNGMKVCLTKGDENNIKITTQKDLDLFEELLKNC